jgi:hypothetical protein
MVEPLPRDRWSSALASRAAGADLQHLIPRVPASSFGVIPCKVDSTPSFLSCVIYNCMIIARIPVQQQYVLASSKMHYMRTGATAAAGSRWWQQQHPATRQ